MHVTVLVPALTITKTANVSTVVPGGVVGYTITVNNTGQTPYTGAVVTDSMLGAQDDAIYNADAVATGGALSSAAPALTWTGDLAIGASIVITYSMTVASPDTGDKAMVNTVSSSTVGSSCLPASGVAGCSSTVVVLTPGLTVVKSAGVSSATLGSSVGFTVVVTDSGQTPYAAANFSDSLAGVLDDGVYAGDASASVGVVSVVSGVLSWSGALSPGQSAVIGYSVVLNSPASGDRVLANAVVSTSVGSNCGAGSADARCVVAVPVVNAVALTLVSSADVASSVAGGVVHFSVTASNAGVSALVGVSFAESLAGVLDDASFNSGSATATGGTGGSVSYAAPTVSWSGSIPAGGSVVVSFSVTVATALSGDDLMTGVVSSSSVPSGDNCLAGSADSRCRTTVPIASLKLILNRPTAEVDHHARLGHPSNRTTFT